MSLVIVFLLLIILALFGLASISQSYASAQQAQAAIEASRAAQIASTGNLVTILAMALVVVTILIAVVVIAYLVYRLKFKVLLDSGNNQRIVSQNASFGHVTQPSANDLLPSILTMLMIQLIRQQDGQRQQFMLEEPQDQLPVLYDAQHYSDFWRM